MQITRTSRWSGKRRTRELNITDEQIEEFNRGVLIQNAFPNLTDDEREFFLTGMTAEKWDEAFPEDDDEELLDDEPAF